MRQPIHSPKPPLVVIRGHRPTSHNARCNSRVTRPEPPQVEVRYAVLSDLQSLPDCGCKALAWHHVKKHRAGRSDQTPGPVSNHQRTNDSDQWVHPEPTIEPTCEKADDRQNGGQCVRQDMKVSCTQIMVVMVTVIMPVLMVVTLVFMFVMTMPVVVVIP